MTGEDALERGEHRLSLLFERGEIAAQPAEDDRAGGTAKTAGDLLLIVRTNLKRVRQLEGWWYRQSPTAQVKRPNTMVMVNKRLRSRRSLWS